MGYMGYKNSEVYFVLLSQRFQTLLTVTQQVILLGCSWVALGYSLLKHTIRSSIPYHYFLDYHWFPHH